MDLDFDFREIKKLDQQMIRDNQRSKEDAAYAGSCIMSGQATWPLEIKILLNWCRGRTLATLNPVRSGHIVELDERVFSPGAKIGIGQKRG